MFRAGMLALALDRPLDRAVTDEASAIERLGLVPRLVTGDALNFKVTSSPIWCWRTGRARSGQRREITRRTRDESANRAGMGRAPAGGGAASGTGRGDILFDKGLDGHSDADALCHAITDALFAQQRWATLAGTFPTLDLEFKGADSRVLLREAVRRVREADDYRERRQHGDCPCARAGTVRRSHAQPSGG